jgi:hypothetical protein
MKFIGTFLLMNFACFLPLYVLNARESLNPFSVLWDRNRPAFYCAIKLFYARPMSTDPFRINFDFSFVVLLAPVLGAQGPWLAYASATLLVFGFVAVLYAAAMQSIFGRPPSLVADLLLLKAGQTLMRRSAYLIVAVAVLGLAALGAGAYSATSWLLRSELPNPSVAVVAATLMSALCFFRWRSYGYEYFLGRGVYSPFLHLWRNIDRDRRIGSVFAKDSAYFERLNHFKDVAFRDRPTVIMICIESYGSVVYRDAERSAEVAELVAAHEGRLGKRGLHFATTHSDAPIFAGGSWLSYASLTYGIEFTQPQLYDALFAAESRFGAYESLFHVLKRNGYRNVVLCPLGGVNPDQVDWGQIDRCFQSDLNITFDSLAYRGPLINFFGMARLYSPLDQYSLNYAYECASRERSSPFSLFFCTLNSHYPWEAVGEVAEDWRSLNAPTARSHACSGSMQERYLQSIRYQLDYVLRFVHERAGDDAVFVIFGDHQPPIITPRAMGKQTPIHVIARNREFVDVFLRHGFVECLNLAGKEPLTMKHQGFLSLFLKAMQTAYGAQGESLEYRKEGVKFFDERSAA